MALLPAPVIELLDAALVADLTVIGRDGLPPHRPGRATIQGMARIVEDDPHVTWERVLPLWRAKEPVIDRFLKMRFALPLFFERGIIEVTPTRGLYWPAWDAP